MNAQLKFAILKIQRFCLKQGIEIEVGFSSLLQDFSLFLFTRSRSQQNTTKKQQQEQPASSPSKKIRNLISPDQMIHFLYMNNSHVLFTESEIYQLLTYGLTHFNVSQNIDVTEFDNWVMMQSLELQYPVYKDNVEKNLSADMRMKKIPLERITLISEEEYKIEQFDNDAEDSVSQQLEVPECVYNMGPNPFTTLRRQF